MFTKPRFLKVLTDSGLKLKSELSPIFGVSRVTLHNYKNSRQPHFLIAARIELATKTLEGLVHRGKLPFPADMPAEKRAEQVQKIVQYVDEHV